MVEIAPETVAVMITDWPRTAVDGMLIVTPGGCAGTIVTLVFTVSLKPVTSVAVAETIYVPSV
jgi:hypothetical protein